VVEDGVRQIEQEKEKRDSQNSKIVGCEDSLYVKFYLRIRL
jgi:hypothetical protein